MVSHPHFFNLTFLSPYVMLAESASVVIYEFLGVVLFYVVNFYFYSRLVYSFSAYRKRYDPRTEIICESSVGKQTPLLARLSQITSELWRGSTWSRWCQVKVHGTSWSDSSRHSPGIFIGGEESVYVLIQNRDQKCVYIRGDKTSLRNHFLVPR